MCVFNSGIEEYPFRKKFSQAVKQLTEQLGVSSLGRLYDRPIYLPATDSVLLVCCQELPGEKAFNGAEMSIWYPFEQFEMKVCCMFLYVLTCYKFYVRYCDLSPQSKLDQLSTSFTGRRFLTAILYVKTHWFVQI